MADIFGPRDALFEEGVVEMLGLERSVGREIDRWTMNRARSPSVSGRSVNSSIQLALTRASGLSEVDGRQETDQ